MRLQLNAFLLRQGIMPVGAISQSFMPHTEWAYWAGARLEWLDMIEDRDLLDAAVSGDVVVALLRRPTEAPAWQQFVEDVLGVVGLAGGSDSLGAIVFCATSDQSRIQWVTWCFGSGSRAMRKYAAEPRFGLVAALNTLAPDMGTLPTAGGAVQSTGPAPRLRELRYRTTTPYFQQTGHRAARDIPVEGFRVDRSSDLVSAVGGRSADPLLARVEGGRSLRFETDIEQVADLVKLSEEIVRRSRVNHYKAAFGWVDNITPVYDEALIEILRQRLLAEFRADPLPPTVDVLLPDDLLDIGDDRSIQYVLFPGERRQTASRMTLTPTLVSRYVVRSDDPADSSRVLDAEFRFLDEGHEPVGAPTLLECLCADLMVDGEQYMAYDGDFYKVDHTFAKGIDDQLGRLPESDLMLPSYRGETEGRYNERVGREYPEHFAVLDRSLVRLSGETGIEACDLLGASGALVHVKRKGKSSVLSHLFLQAVNSCAVLRRSAEAREQLKVMIEAHAASQALVVSALEELTRLEHGGDGVEVVFAFLGDWRHQTIMSLPFFSRVSLVQAARRISELGYRVSVKLVGIR